MKKALALIFAALMLFSVSACKKPAQEAQQSGQEPEQEQKPEYSNRSEFDVMKLELMAYGTEYVSLYDKFGADTTVADVKEDENGFAYIERDGNKYLLGLDFLAKAMIENTRPAGDIATSDEAHAFWWKYYIKRWNYLLPEIPITRNMIYTVYNKKLSGVGEEPVNPYWDIADCLVYWSSGDGSVSIGLLNEVTGSFRIPGFIDGYFNDADIAVNKLTNGCEAVARTKDGGYCWNPTVVRSHEEKLNEDGSVTYTVTLWDDLYFSDGSRITAKDYVTKPLVMITPVFREAGGYTEAKVRPEPIFDFVSVDEPIRNYFPYDDSEADGSGHSPVCPWIRLLSDTEYSVTIPGGKANDYYSIAYFNYSPDPHAMWLGEADLADDGEGCYITNEFYLRHEKDKYSLRAEELARYLMAFDGEAFEKYPWSGAYVPVQKEDTGRDPAVFGEGLIRMKLVKNPYFKGNYEGVKPSVETVFIEKAISDTLTQDIEEGRFDVYDGITGAYDVDRLLDLIEKRGDEFGCTCYYRAGYGKFGFRADLGPVQFSAVRRALAYCIPMELFLEDAYGYGRDDLEKYGSLISAPYHESTREYKYAAENGLSLDPYETSVEKAIAELEADGWVYNEKGEKYESGIRYKRIPGELMTARNKEYKVEFSTYDPTGTVETTYEYRTVRIGDDYYMPLAINFYDVATESFVMYDFYGEDSEIMSAIGCVICGTWGDFASMLDERSEASNYGRYGGIPTYNMFRFATGFNTPRYDHRDAFTLDPALYGSESEYFLRDWADLYFIDG